MVRVHFLQDPLGFRKTVLLGKKLALEAIDFTHQRKGLGVFLAQFLNQKGSVSLAQALVGQLGGQVLDLRFEGGVLCEQLRDLGCVGLELSLVADVDDLSIAQLQLHCQELSPHFL